MQTSFTNDIQRRFQESNIVMRLIYINIAVFILQLILTIVRLDFVNTWFMFPADPLQAGTHIWSLLSYQFMHADPMHLLFNMLWLYWFGELLFFVLYNLIPSLRASEAVLLGASASVTAIGVAVATYRPDLPIRMFIIGEIKIKYVVGFMILLDFYNIQTGTNIGGNYSHVGGAFFGFFFGREMIKGRDITYAFSKLLEKIMWQYRRATHKGPMLRQPVNDRERDFNSNARKRSNQAEVDAILEKISKSGYASLSHEEKEILFRAGGK
jgi:membrane associated rhomboid family serine protease